MSDYKEQVNSLREHADLIETSIELYGPSATRLLVYDLRNAAAAIEDLQAELEKKRTSDCWGCKCEKMEASGRLQKRGKPVLLAALPTASPWHRVEEELPEPIHQTDPRYKAYLICDSLGYMHVADYTYSKHFPTCYSFHVNGEEETDVKYWMPIEPPKEDEHGN